MVPTRTSRLLSGLVFVIFAEAAMATEPIIDYIQSHYRPERMLDGQLQVWVPQAR